jgi:hypothetical protein
MYVFGPETANSLFSDLRPQRVGYEAEATFLGKDLILEVQITIKRKDRDSIASVVY